MNLEKFNFNGNNVTVITDEVNNPWWIAKEVCEVLGIDNRETRRKLDDDEVGNTHIVDSLGRKQEVIIINESGLYSLIMRSRKPEAKSFRKWVTSEVLPSIRKNGGYIHTTENMTDSDIMARALVIANKTIEAREHRIEELKRSQGQINNKKTATAMATASKLSRENDKLRQEIGDAKEWKQAKAIPWLSEYFDLRNRGVYTALGKALAKISKQIGRDVRKIEDTRYGHVNVYHIDAINDLRDDVLNNRAMKLYRRDS